MFFKIINILLTYESIQQQMGKFNPNVFIFINENVKTNQRNNIQLFFEMIIHQTLPRGSKLYLRTPNHTHIQFIEVVQLFHTPTRTTTECKTASE